MAMLLTVDRNIPEFEKPDKMRNVESDYRQFLIPLCCDFRPFGVYFLDYIAFEGCPEFHFRFSFKDLRHPEICLTDDIVLHILELPVFERIKTGKVDSDLAEWIRFFNNAVNETEETVMENYTNPNIHKAFRALQVLSADEEARQLAEMRERALKDEVSELNEARREGERRGERRGMLRLIFETLELRFRFVSDEIREKLNAVEDSDTLASVQRRAVTAESLEEFDRHLSSL